MADMAIAYLESLQSPVPSSVDEAAAVALKREGALALIEQAWEWEPESVTEERHNREQGEAHE